jgi:homoserine dehydrogenase
VAQVFADNGVSIQTVRQDGLGEDARLVVRTHLAADSALAATIERLRASDSVRGVLGVMRVEGESGR